MTKSLKCGGLHTREITSPNCQEGNDVPCQRFLPKILCHGGGTWRDRRIRDAEERRNGTESSTAPLAGRITESYSGNRHRVHRFTAYDEYFEGEYFHVGTLPMVFVLHDLGTDSQCVQNFCNSDCLRQLFVLLCCFRRRAAWRIY